MHWNPFAHDPHFLVSNIIYALALVLLLTGVSRKTDAVVSFCSAWMLIVACLLYRVASVCIAFPIGLDGVLVGILGAAPLQLLVPPTALSVLVCGARMIRNYRQGDSLRSVIVNASLLVVGLAAVLLTAFFILELDFSVVGDRWP